MTISPIQPSFQVLPGTLLQAYTFQSLPINYLWWETLNTQPVRTSLHLTLYHLRVCLLNPSQASLLENDRAQPTLSGFHSDLKNFFLPVRSPHSFVLLVYIFAFISYLGGRVCSKGKQKYCFYKELVVMSYLHTC